MFPLTANSSAQRAQPDEASGQPNDPPLFTPADRFRLACLQLRESGKLDMPLPDKKSKSESPLEWLVRHELAPDPHTAAEMLCLAFGLTAEVDRLTGSTFQQDLDAVDRLCKKVMRHTYK